MNVQSQDDVALPVGKLGADDTRLPVQIELLLTAAESLDLPEGQPAAIGWPSLQHGNAEETFTKIILENDIKIFCRK